jgi:hypothetical protein
MLVQLYPAILTFLSFGYGVQMLSGINIGLHKDLFSKAPSKTDLLEHK